MDSKRFDAVTAKLTTEPTRRGALRLLGVVALGAAGLGILPGEDAAARKKKRGERCLRAGALCDSDRQCCSANQICEVPQNASNSDTRCCGGSGAVCGGVNEDGDFVPPFCCIGEAGVRSFVCGQSDPERPFVRGTCIPNPGED